MAFPHVFLKGAQIGLISLEFMWIRARFVHDLFAHCLITADAGQVGPPEGTRRRLGKTLPPARTRWRGPAGASKGDVIPVLLSRKGDVIPVLLSRTVTYVIPVLLSLPCH